LLNSFYSKGVSNNLNPGHDEFIMTFKFKKTEKFMYLLSKPVGAGLKDSPGKELGAVCRLASTATCSHISDLCYKLNT